MPDTSNIPNINLKVILLTHFLFLALSTLGVWAPTGYLIYNYGLIGCLLWSITKPESADAVQFAFVLNVVSVILDILTISIFFPHSLFPGQSFAVACAILHLIVRPFSSIYLLQVVRNRTGNAGLLANVYPPAGRNSSYEDIEGTAASAPAAAASYDFSSAQQI